MKATGKINTVIMVDPKDVKKQTIIFSKDPRGNPAFPAEPLLSEKPLLIQTPDFYESP